MSWFFLMSAIAAGVFLGRVGDVYFRRLDGRMRDFFYRCRKEWEANREK